MKTIVRPVMLGNVFLVLSLASFTWGFFAMLAVECGSRMFNISSFDHKDLPWLWNPDVLWCCGMGEAALSVIFHLKGIIDLLVKNKP